jgi:hypothetical protein
MDFTVGTVMGSLFGLALAFLMVMFITFFLLRDGRRGWQTLLGWIPKRGLAIGPVSDLSEPLTRARQKEVLVDTHRRAPPCIQRGAGSRCGSDPRAVIPSRVRQQRADAYSAVWTCWPPGS